MKVFGIVIVLMSACILMPSTETNAFSPREDQEKKIYEKYDVVFFSKEFNEGDILAPIKIALGDEEELRRKLHQLGVDLAKIAKLYDEFNAKANIDTFYFGTIGWNERNASGVAADLLPRSYGYKHYVAVNYSKKSAGYYLISGHHAEKIENIYYRGPLSFIKAGYQIIKEDDVNRRESKGATKYHMDRDTSKKDVVGEIIKYANYVSSRSQGRNISKDKLIGIHDCVKNCMKALERDRDEVRPGQHEGWAREQSSEAIKKEIKKNCKKIIAMI
ncbi:hypothetical protein [Rubinisphaera italica]|uniref:Lipoprotein n=1 Tax=Rubinisphaera italica TaxID=2527969 RepID=A0A5C5XMV8_9PLAN|nr:hypothetical protein [Rubinisphaera italica]TWT64234.1 hypothetical protein Pan54_49950 [Rubinisphaera italica]